MLHSLFLANFLLSTHFLILIYDVKTITASYLTGGQKQSWVGHSRKLIFLLSLGYNQ